jgi:hypothetical protein
VVTDAYLPNVGDGMDQQTTLDGAINSTVTTITVASTALFASAGYIIINTEVVTYTGKTSTTFTGCTRGALGTTNTSHSDLDVVVCGPLGRTWDQVVEEIKAIETDLLGTFAQDITLATTVALNLNAGGTSRVVEGSANVIDIEVSSTPALSIGTQIVAQNRPIVISAGQALILDGSASTTYLRQTSADLVDLVVDNVIMTQWDKEGADAPIVRIPFDKSGLDGNTAVLDIGSASPAHGNQVLQRFRGYSTDLFIFQAQGDDWYFNNNSYFDGDSWVQPFDGPSSSMFMHSGGQAVNFFTAVAGGGVHPAWTHIMRIGTNTGMTPPNYCPVVYISSATNLSGTLFPANKHLLYVGGSHGDGTTSSRVQNIICSNDSNAYQRMELGYDSTGDFGSIQAFSASDVPTSTDLILAQMGGNVGLGATVAPAAKLHVMGNMAMSAASKFYLDATASAVGTTWMDEVADGIIRFVGNNVEGLRVTSAGAAVPATKALGFDGATGNTTLRESATGVLTGKAGGTDALAVRAASLAIPSAAKFYFDGVAATGNTWMDEISSDNLRVVAGNAEAARFLSTGVAVAAGKKLFFDGPTGHEYLIRPADSIVDMYVGSALITRWAVGPQRIEMGAFDNGTGVGPQFIVAYNNNSTTPAAGTLVLYSLNGTPYYFWVDASGVLRQGASAPTNATDTSAGSPV